MFKYRLIFRKSVLCDHIELQSVFLVREILEVSLLSLSHNNLEINMMKRITGNPNKDLLIIAFCFWRLDNDIGFFAGISSNQLMERDFILILNSLRIDF